MTMNIAGANIYGAYMFGWKHGATCSSQDRLLVEHENPKMREAYTAGYTAGYKARAEARKVATELSGYEPTVLRAQSFPVKEYMK